MKTTLIAKLESTCLQFHYAPALIYKGTTLTYQEVFRKLQQYACAMISLMPPANKDHGANKICILGHNKLETIICQLAALYSGMSFVTLDPSAPLNVIEAQLHAIEPALVIQTNKATHAKERQHNAYKNISVHDLLDSPEQHAPHPLPINSDENSLAYLLYTSGSTGVSKAVMQTHAGLYQQVLTYTAFLAISSEEKFSQLAPIFHDQAIVDIYSALLNGACLCLFDVDGYDMHSTRHFLSEQKISLFSSTPQLFSALFAEQNKTSFPYLRKLAIGADAVTEKTLRVFIENLPEVTVFIGE